MASESLRDCAVLQDGRTLRHQASGCSPAIAIWVGMLALQGFQGGRPTACCALLGTGALARLKTTCNSSDQSGLLMLRLVLEIIGRHDCNNVISSAGMGARLAEPASSHPPLSR